MKNDRFHRLDWGVFMGRRHKTLIAALLVLVTAQHSLVWGQTVAPNTLQWQPTLEDAKRLASQTNRLVLVHFWSPSCAPCLQLEQNVFSQLQVQQAIQARFVPIKLNADDWPTTVKCFGVTRLPTDLVITPGGQIVGRMLSPPTADAYLQQLNVAASGTGPAASPTGAAYVMANPTTSVAPVTQSAFASAMPPAAATSRYGMMEQSAATPAATVQNTPAPSTNPPAVSAYSDSRYAEFYQRFGGTSATGGAANSVAGVPSVVNGALTVPTQQNYQSAPNPYSADGRYGPVASPQAQSSPTPPNPGQAAPAASWSTQIPSPAIGTPSSAPVTPSTNVPPLGLEGYSPVAVIEQQRWQLGDRRWGAIHRGRTYLFTGPEEQQKFLANPDRYSPALSGHDPVVALDYGQEVDGRRQFGVEYANRMYLFSSEASQRAFTQNPNRYVAEVLQVENPARTTVR